MRKNKKRGVKRVKEYIHVHASHILYMVAKFRGSKVLHFVSLFHYSVVFYYVEACHVHSNVQVW